MPFQVIISSFRDALHFLENSPISSGIDSIGTCIAALPAPLTALSAVIISCLVLRLLFKLL